MSNIRERTTYTTHCGGCGHEYGETFDSKARAEEFISHYPICYSCEVRKA